MNTRFFEVRGTGRRAAALPLFTAMVLLAAPVLAAADNVVVEWNAIAVGTALAVAQGPVPQTRSMAVVAVAVNDAVNGLTRRFATYAQTGAAPAGASANAAAIGAAHRALSLLFPTQTAALDAARAASIAAHGISPSDPGIAFGEAVADGTFASRSNDGAAQAQFAFPAPGAGSPGVWVPTPPANLPALLPGWGAVTPWVLRSGDQFRPDEGPLLTSHRYARDFNEVKTMGSATSATRSAEQTNVVRFWLTSAAVIWDGALRLVATARGLDASEAAHAFALVNVAGADAAIACWDAKYTFDFWRPITAIHNADADGNPDTSADPAWSPLAPTPNFPEFVSGHAVISSAMGTMLALLFGDDRGGNVHGPQPDQPRVHPDVDAVQPGNRRSVRRARLDRISLPDVRHPRCRSGPARRTVCLQACASRRPRRPAALSKPGCSGHRHNVNGVHRSPERRRLLLFE